MSLMERLLSESDIWRSPCAREIAVIMARPVGRTSAGFPFLEPSAWKRFRDWVPHLLPHSSQTLEAIETVEQRALAIADEPEQCQNIRDAAKVLRQVVMTAAITSPSDLWLTRFVVSALHEVGLAAPLLAGESVHPGHLGLQENELRVDLRFLLSRGLVTRSGDAFRLSAHGHARRIFEELPALEDVDTVRASSLWACASAGETLDEAASAALIAQPRHLQNMAVAREPGLWMPTPWEVELGFRLVPLIVGLQASGALPAILSGERPIESLSTESPTTSAAAAQIFQAAGLWTPAAGLNPVGRRVLERGPGPMGIIEAYHPYLVALPKIHHRGRGEVWVERSANVAASQVANAKSFEKANDALDAFCTETGFQYDVFIEHALGKGEATRQRFERSGDATLHYVGADLEDAAIDAALAEQLEGHLPPDMKFVRNADIGKPEILLDAIEAAGWSANGAVMMVGNGFHEVRDPSDETMEAIFASYCRAGIVLLFTEETGLAVEDLLATAWNTYHAGFKYVHERSGQGLRPALPRPPSGLSGKLPASWTECAERAGYVSVPSSTSKSRTVYPYPPPSGHNPAISVLHVFVPQALAAALELHKSQNPISKITRSYE